MKAELGDFDAIYAYVVEGEGLCAFLGQDSR